MSQTNPPSSPPISGNGPSRSTTTAATTTTRNYGQDSQTITQHSPKSGSTFRNIPVAKVEMEMTSLQRQIDELDKKLELAESRESQDLDKIVEDVQENTRRQIHQGADEMASGFRKMCELQLESLKRREEEYSEQSKENMKAYQDNIFKTNRVFREVSRLLRDEWQPLFCILLAAFPKDRVEQEILALEYEKPVMQPYKALVRWKEMAGEDFGLDRLIQVLQDSGMFEASQKAREIVFSDSSSYITDFSCIKPLPQAQSAKVAEILASVGNHMKPIESSEAEGGKSFQEVEYTSGPSWATMNTGPISNSKLLHASKKVGGQWKRLAKQLGISEQETNDIQELVEGDNQQCAFQILYKWRDGVTGSDESSANDLAQAMSQIGRSDLAKDFNIS